MLLSILAGLMIIMEQALGLALWAIEISLQIIIKAG